MKKDNLMMTENYCPLCDWTVHAVFDATAFYAHKVGRIVCPVCGAMIVPCNECDDHDACGDCPWKKADATKDMSDEAYIRFIREHDRKLYEIFKSGDNGDYYKKIIEKIEAKVK